MIVTLPWSSTTDVFAARGLPLSEAALNDGAAVWVEASAAGADSTARSAGSSAGASGGGPGGTCAAAALQIASAADARPWAAWRRPWRIEAWKTDEKTKPDDGDTCCR
ncbi:MAG: hypothetical protein QM661_05000 [Solimonas sp.]